MPKCAPYMIRSPFRCKQMFHQLTETKERLHLDLEKNFCLLIVTYVNNQDFKLKLTLKSS